MLWDSQISRAESQTWTWSWVAKSLSPPPVTSFGLAKAVSSPLSVWPRTTGGGWVRDRRALRCHPRRSGRSHTAALSPGRGPAPGARPPRSAAAVLNEGHHPSAPVPSALSSLKGSGESSPAVSQRRIHRWVTPVRVGTHTPPRPAAPRRPPGLRRWQGLQAPRPAAPSPSPLPPAPGPSSRHWFGAGAPGARAPLPAPAPAAAAAAELSVRRQRRGPGLRTALSTALRPRRRGAAAAGRSRYRAGGAAAAGAAPAGPGTEMGSPARTGAMGAGPRAGLAPAAPEGRPPVRSGGTVGAPAAAAAVLEKGLRSGHPAVSQPRGLGAAGRARAAARAGCAPSVLTERLNNSGKCPSYPPSHLSFPILNGSRVYVGRV